jgi:hypothetical protein
MAWLCHSARPSITRSVIVLIIPARHRVQARQDRVRLGAHQPSELLAGRPPTTVPVPAPLNLSKFSFRGSGCFGRRVRRR